MFRPHPYLVIFGVFGLISACVPKTQYDDQSAKLQELEERLARTQSSEDCDKDTMIQLREQAQSLDLLSQELVDRNTELSKEVSRLQAFERDTKAKDRDCEARMADMQSSHDEQLKRTRATYEDLLKELREENRHLRESAEAVSQDHQAPKAPKSSKTPPSKKPDERKSVKN